MNFKSSIYREHRCPYSIGDSQRAKQIYNGITGTKVRSADSLIPVLTDSQQTRRLAALNPNVDQNQMLTICEHQCPPKSMHRGKKGLAEVD